MITAASGLIETGAIGTAQIADGSITDAKIVELTANKIAAGTIDASQINVINLRADNLTVGTINGQRIPVLGTEKIADGAISGVKVAQDAITADKIVAEAITAAKIAANAITANKIASQAITADKVNITSLFGANATIDAIKTMTVKSVEDGSALILNKDQIRMEAPSTVIAIPGGEEGQEVFRADAGGVYADKIESPTVVRRVPGGIYLVGSGMDFGSLDEAFDWLEGKQLSGDIVLKLTRDDPVGALRGVTGGYDVLITGANLVNYWDTPIAQGATGAPNAQGSGIIATITSAGGLYNRVIYPLGAVDDLGIRGMDILLRTTITWVSGRESERDRFAWAVLGKLQHAVRQRIRRGRQQHRRDGVPCSDGCAARRAPRPCPVSHARDRIDGWRRDGILWAVGGDRNRAVPDAASNHRGDERHKLRRAGAVRPCALFGRHPGARS